MLLRGLTWLVLFQLLGTAINHLLVPPAVGVMVYAADIVADFWPIAGALVLSLVLAMAFCGVLMQKMINRGKHSGERP